MQKVINVLAIASTVVSAAVVGSGIYVYVNRASIIDGVKQQAIEAATGALPDLLGSPGTLPTLPDTTGPAMAPLEMPKGL